MQALARFAVRRRWFVVAGWIVFIVALQALLGGLGGSDYRDDFKLPDTETQTVAQLLSAAGLDSQNGATGTVVLHARNRAPSPTTPGRCSRPCGSCATAASASPRPTRRTAWSPAASPTPAGGDAAAAAAQVSKDKTIAVVDLNWAEQQPTIAQITDVPRRPRTAELGEPAGGVHRQRLPGAGGRDQGRAAGGDRVPGGPDHPVPGLPDRRRDGAAAGQRDRRDGQRAGPDRPAVPPDVGGHLRQPAGVADDPRRRGRLRAVHRHPASSQPDARHGHRGLHRAGPQHLRARRAVRRASPSASPCWACGRWASASCTGCRWAPRSVSR